MESEKQNRNRLRCREQIVPKGGKWWGGGGWGDLVREIDEGSEEVQTSSYKIN